MTGPVLLAFAGGLVAGLLISFFAYRRVAIGPRVAFPVPNVTDVVCQAGGTILIKGAAAGSVQNLTLARLYTFVYNTTVAIPATPPAGAMAHNPPFPLTHVLPSGLTAPNNFAVVWAEYHGFVSRGISYPKCP